MAAIIVDPREGLLDEPLIQVRGLSPGERVRIRMDAVTLGADASAEFVADGAGMVDVSIAAPVSGDYEGRDSLGLFWSARFREGADLLTMFAALGRLQPLEYAIGAERDGDAIAPAAFVCRLLPAGIERVDVRDGRLRGTFFSPGSRDGLPLPPVLVLGGSDGGNTFEFVAALLAARGYAALALAYFAYEDLPQEFLEIPVEYFGEAIEWLRARPEVAGARVGVLGMSRGGELALLLGATYPEIVAVVALVPSGLTGSAIGRDPALMTRAAWTRGGQPLPCPPPMFDDESMSAAREAFTTGRPFAGTPGFLRLLQREDARLREAEIPVERTRGPIFMMSAEDDQIWPSTPLTEVAVRRLREATFPYAYEHVSYPGAGHFACLPPSLPTTRNWSRHPLVPLPLAYGGTPRDTAAASADVWARIMTFLREHLVAGATT